MTDFYMKCNPGLKWVNYQLYMDLVSAIDINHYKQIKDYAYYFFNSVQPLLFYIFAVQSPGYLFNSFMSEVPII